MHRFPSAVIPVSHTDYQFIYQRQERSDGLYKRIAQTDSLAQNGKTGDFPLTPVAGI